MKPRALFRTWLYAIGFRILRAHRRKAAFRAMFSGSGAPASRSRRTGHLDKDLLIRDAVRKLDRIDREVLLLREFEQLTYAEIATLLRVPVNTVRSRLFRARLELRNLLSAPALVSRHTGIHTIGGTRMTSTAQHIVTPEDIMALLDGELSAAEAKVVSTHIDECAECADIAAQFRATSHSLAAWTVPRRSRDPRFRDSRSTPQRPQSRRNGTCPGP